MLVGDDQPHPGQPAFGQRLDHRRRVFRGERETGSDRLGAIDEEAYRLRAADILQIDRRGMVGRGLLLWS